MSSCVLSTSYSPAQTAISRIAEIFGRDWLMVIFYGDESGTHGKGNYVVSGYLAHKDTWTVFSRLWSETLRASNPRPVKYLKMSEWQHRDTDDKSGFFGWTDSDAETKLLCLASVLGAFLSNGSIGEYTSIVPWSLYNQYIDGECKKVFSDPYYLNLRSIVLMALSDLSDKTPPFSDKISFIFDQGNSAEVHAGKHYLYTKRYADPNLREFLGELSFADDHDEPGLQAADLIAWNTRRNLAGISKQEELPYSVYQVLTKVSQRSFNVVTEEWLRFLNMEVNNAITAMAPEAIHEDD